MNVKIIQGYYNGWEDLSEYKEYCFCYSAPKRIITRRVSSKVKKGINE